jgi:hypothetical protein
LSWTKSYECNRYKASFCRGGTEGEEPQDGTTSQSKFADLEKEYMALYQQQSQQQEQPDIR